MRIEINTTEKSITLQESIQLEDLIKELELLLGDNYKNYWILPSQITIASQWQPAPYYNTDITCTNIDRDGK